MSTIAFVKKTQILLSRSHHELLIELSRSHLDNSNDSERAIYRIRTEEHISASLSGFCHLANSQALSKTCKCLAGLHELLTELSAALQHLCQLLQLHLHLSTVVFIDRVHVLLHLLAHLRHLGNEYIWEHYYARGGGLHHYKYRTRSFGTGSLPFPLTSPESCPSPPGHWCGCC